MARPTKYREDTANEILRLLVEEKASLRQICNRKGMPALRTLFEWKNSNEKFLQRYNAAMEARNVTLAEEIIDIADDSSIPAEQKKVMLQARQWLAARVLPRIYGDKVQQEISGVVDHKNHITQIEYVIVDVPDRRPVDVIESASSTDDEPQTAFPLLKSPEATDAAFSRVRQPDYERYLERI